MKLNGNKEQESSLVMFSVEWKTKYIGIHMHEEVHVPFFTSGYDTTYQKFDCLPDFILWAAGEKLT